MQSRGIFGSMPMRDKGGRRWLNKSTFLSNDNLQPSICIKFFQFLSLNSRNLISINWFNITHIILVFHHNIIELNRYIQDELQIFSSLQFCHFRCFHHQRSFYKHPSLVRPPAGRDHDQLQQVGHAPLPPVPRLDLRRCSQHCWGHCSDPYPVTGSGIFVKINK